MRFIAKHKFAFILTAVVLLVLSLAVSSFFTQGRVSPLSNAINAVFRPLHTFIGSVSDYFARLSDGANRYDDLLARYESLRVYVANMEEEKRNAQELAEENDRLRGLLGLGLRERGFTFEIATIIERSTSAWERTFTLGKGSEAGIAVRQCVLSSEGYLVGVVTQAGNGWATVAQVTDTAFSAGAVIERTGQAAVAAGEWALLRESRIKLKYLPLGSDIQFGDLVLTSGMGGVYPPDIPIGKVASVQPEASGQTEYATLVPEADLDMLTQVFIVLDFFHSE